LSVGDLLRDELNNPSSQAGAQINACIKEGELVPAHLVVGLIEKAVDLFVNQGKFNFLVDGFPRSQDNWSAWETSELNLRVDIPFALFFECPFDVLEARLLNRGKTSNRADDNLSSIKKRFATFEKESLPVVGMFQQMQKLRAINSNRAADEVWAETRMIFC